MRVNPEQRSLRSIPIPFLHFNLQEKYEEAEWICKRSLAIREKTLNSDHPEVAQSLDTLAAILRRQVGSVSENWRAISVPNVEGCFY